VDEGGGAAQGQGALGEMDATQQSALVAQFGNPALGEFPVSHRASS
jgi:hypothetical protein